MNSTDFHKKITNKHAMVLIGEDHQGNWVNTPQVNNAIDEVVNYFVQNNLPIVCWYEGEMKGGSPSFKAFVKYLSTKYPKQKIEQRSWEPSARTVMNKEERLAVALLGQDVPAFKRHLGRGIFLDELIKNRGWRADKTENITKDDIIKLVSKSVYKDDYLDLLEEPITDEVLRDWFDLREEAYDDVTSKLYALVNAPNKRRQDHLYNLLKSESGIYLIGASHVSLMKSRNKLP
jgi:hypothetical protein